MRWILYCARARRLARLLIAVPMLVLSLAAPARADMLGTRVQELEQSPDTKTRLAAALWLAAHTDARSFHALIRALGQDADAKVRQVAAKSLGMTRLARASAATRAQAVAALTRASRTDSDALVRRLAKGALSEKPAAGTAKGGQKGTGQPEVFINIGSPSLGKHNLPKELAGSLHEALYQAMHSHAPLYQVRWPEPRLPTQEQLRQRRMAAYYIGAALSELQVTRKQGTVEVQCGLSFHVTPWDGEGTPLRWRAEETAWATGKGMTRGRDTQLGVDAAMRDCMASVADQMIARRVVPFLNMRTAAVP